MGEAAAVLDVQDRDDVPALTLGDEAELRAFFAMYVPPAPGAVSGFGAMCNRLANAKNPKTTELPSPNGPWTEMVECAHALSAAGDGEDAMIAHLDALRRMRHVRRALDAIERYEREVLAMHYGGDLDAAGPLGRLSAVATLTSAAISENRRRAARDRHETVEETLADVAVLAKRPGAQRVGARAILDAVRREASTLLDSARTSFARARRGEP